MNGYTHRVEITKLCQSSLTLYLPFIFYLVVVVVDVFSMSFGFVKPTQTFSSHEEFIPPLDKWC